MFPVPAFEPPPGVECLLFHNHEYAFFMLVHDEGGLSMPDAGLKANGLKFLWIGIESAMSKSSWR